ncbi:MAG: TSUP family transporter, partial [Actinobacteria bacterium]|nr:TSUP family transporter [Actinomycetota bacterium]
MIEIFVVAAAGVLGGASNVLAGGGSLITFPTLVALGVSPLSANVTNTVGLVPGAIGGAAGSADLLAGQERRLLRLGLPRTLGAAGGAALLLVTPAKSFEAVVPGLVAISCLLLLLQPR